jgi:hypothetical protein
MDQEPDAAPGKTGETPAPSTVWQLPAVAFGASIVLFWRAVLWPSLTWRGRRAANDVFMTVGLFRGEFSMTAGLNRAAG